MKKMSLALALAAGFAVAAPSVASACDACGHRTHYTSRVQYSRNVRVAQPAYHYSASYSAPACRPAPVCQPVCQPVCDPCRRSGLLGLGILGIL